MIWQAGKLRSRIRIMRPMSTRDAEGNSIPTEELVCECWAAVKDATTKEFYEAAARQMDDVVNFIIRWREGISSGMIILHGGRRHEIKQVSRLSHLRDFMELKTVRRAVTS